MCSIAKKRSIFIHLDTRIQFELTYDDNIHLIKLRTHLNWCMIIKCTFRKAF